MRTQMFTNCIKLFHGYRTRMTAMSARVQAREHAWNHLGGGARIIVDRRPYNNVLKY